MTQKITKQLHKLQENNNKPHDHHEHALAVLGSEIAVAELSKFYEKHSEVIDTITASLIVDYLLKNNVNSEQAEAFKNGVLQFANFFEQCKIEMDLRNNKDRGII